VLCRARCTLDAAAGVDSCKELAGQDKGAEGCLQVPRHLRGRVAVGEPLPTVRLSTQQAQTGGLKRRAAAACGDELPDGELVLPVLECVLVGLNDDPFAELVNTLGRTGVC
jgi:hypothetical protein